MQVLYFTLLVFCLPRDGSMFGKPPDPSDPDFEIKQDASLPAPKLIKKYGYPSEVHHVTTKDGYILEVHRIPHGKNTKRIRDHKKVVLVTHGIFSSSTDFLIMGPKKALGYVLADAGYDVWLINCRGNTYSTNHTTLSTTSLKFWDFSWHEIGIYDLPATIDYILGKTGNKDLFYLAHSQGTTAYLVLTSTLRKYNAKIRTAVLLAPIAWLKHIGTSGRAMLTSNPIQEGAEFIGLEILPQNHLRGDLTDAACADDSETQDICADLFFMIGGKDSKNLNRTLLPIIFGHYPSTSSVKQSLHYTQETLSGTFRHFDYGFPGNLIRYKRLTPPNYNLKRSVAPIVLFTASNDYLSDLIDVQTLVKHLRNMKENILIPDKKWTHIDYVQAMSAKDLVYDHVIEIFDSY